MSERLTEDRIDHDFFRNAIQTHDFANSSLLTWSLQADRIVNEGRSVAGNDDIVPDALVTGEMDFDVVGHSFFGNDRQMKDHITSIDDLGDKNTSETLWLKDSTDGNAVLRFLDGPQRTECVKMVSSAKIYQRLLAYVYVQLKTSTTPRSARHAYDSLCSAVDTWGVWDHFQWLANHHTVRLTLWDILNQGTASGYGQHAHCFNLQQLLNSDFIAIQSQMLIVLNSRKRKGDFYGVCSADPVPILNLLQTIIDQGNLSTNHRSRFVRTLTHLTKSFARLPDCLMLSGVKRSGKDPVAGGGFADIWTGYFDSNSVAIKALRIYERSDQEKALREFSHEAIIWRLLRHPNILPFYGVFRGDEHFDRICLVSPWMEAGNVTKYLAKNPDSDRFALLGDVVNGLSYLHDFQPAIIHGDLKGANIFVTSRLTACLGDFGLSRFRDSQESTLGATTGTTAGTLRWQSHELFDSREDGRTNRPSQESDIYSFGCVCLELMTGKPPFSEIRGDGAVVKAIMNKQTPQRPAEDLLKYGFDDDLWSLMEKCWSYTPSQRPKMGLLLEYFNRRRGSSVRLNSIKKLSHGTRASLDQYGFPDGHVRTVALIAGLTNTRGQKEELQEIHQARRSFRKPPNPAVDATQFATTTADLQTGDGRHNPIHPYLHAPERYIGSAKDNSKEWYLRSRYGRDDIHINPDGDIMGELDLLRKKLVDGEMKTARTIHELNKEVHELESLIEAKIYREDNLEQEIERLKEELTRGKSSQEGLADLRPRRTSSSHRTASGEDDGNHSTGQTNKPSELLCGDYESHGHIAAECHSLEVF
ncbi:kinase-like protein [Rickenella mellea]|uniref:Kinase-like protein n=1 Tax=Rickenella mellea TaxID=50990 RepID=A0A4Y7PLS3_9AGAM|nr:kinase-like protein [Rickenella mellea]